ncbi:MAG: VIT domain-containing protein, partial [Myxococcota bacterium]
KREKPLWGLIISLIVGCTPTPPAQTARSRAPAAATAETKPEGHPDGSAGIADWSIAQGQALTPPRMDGVLAQVDRLATSARHANFRPTEFRGETTRRRSEAPYFAVEGTTEEESLPLESTRAKVSVAGVIAQVLVKQRYRNRGRDPIEAVYRFPASTGAAVHGMRMAIGRRVITAVIDEKDKARKTYDDAKEAGKRASLLVMERDNVFTMRVANIMPGDKIDVELAYSELLVPEDGVYRFVYPAVVGPRNPMGAEPTESTDWTANPHLQAGEKTPYDFDVSVHLSTPIALKDVRSPSHRVSVKALSSKTADVSLARSKDPGNRDYVLEYRLAGDRIETGAMVYEEGGERFFLAMVEPPQRVAPKLIPAREYIFVLDVSGSMRGFPLAVSKKLLGQLLAKVRPSDRFNVVVFAGTSGLLAAESLPATPSNTRDSMAKIDQLSGGGGTNLMDGLRTAYALPPPTDRALSRSVVVVTDGYVSVEAQSFRFIRKHLGDANLFAFGIGSSVNRALIEGMARAGRGRPFIVLSRKEAPARAEQLRRYIQAPVLTDIDVAYQGVTAYDAVPRQLPDLMAERPLVLFGKLKGKAAGKVIVKGMTGAGAFAKTLDLDASVTARRHRPIRVLWAREWARELMDQHAILNRSPKIAQAVTKLGLAYNLLTPFTSFVAVDRDVVNQRGKGKSVTQALPLPQGVPNTAIPGSEGATSRPRPMLVPPAPQDAGGVG